MSSWNAWIIPPFFKTAKRKAPSSPALLCAAAFLLCLSSAYAGKWTAAEYPLRVHIFTHNGAAHYYNQRLDSSDGEGRANLFEGGQPRGFDFAYRCGDRLRNSIGYETYMARWKKPGRALEILMPELGGKPGSMESCELQVTMKDGAYHMHNGTIGEEPQEKFKNWMTKHQYDPSISRFPRSHPRASRQPGTRPSRPIRAFSV